MQHFEPKLHQDRREFRDFVFKNFDLIDKDQDGFLSQAELELAAHDSSRTLKQVECLEFLIFRLRQIAAAFEEGSADKPNCISKIDVERYFAQFCD